MGDEFIPNLNELNETDNSAECSEPLDDIVNIESIKKQKIDCQVSSNDEIEYNIKDVTNSVALGSINNIALFLTKKNVEAWNCLNQVDHILQRTILLNSKKDSS